MYRQDFDSLANKGKNGTDKTNDLRNAQNFKGMESTPKIVKLENNEKAC